MQKTINEPNMFKNTRKKLVKKTSDSLENKGIAIDGNNLEQFAKYGRNVEATINDMLTLFPDINLSIETMTSLILSPNDMDDPKLTYKLENSYLPSNVKNMITSTLTSYAEAEYNVVDKLDDIITESLYTKGAYVELNIPPKSILDILSLVNKKPTAGIESAFKKSAFLDLGIGKTINDEEFGIEVTDNQSYLFTSLLNETRANAIVSNSIFSQDENIKAGMEGLRVTGEGSAILTAEHISNDKPIVKKISSSSVIPISSKDDTTKHYGYFILLDESGKSISGMPDTLTQEETQNVISGIKANIKGTRKQAPNFKNLEEMKDTLLKQTLQKYLKDSVYKDLVSLDISIDDNIMLAIANHVFNKTKLKVIFVPKELVSYFAVNFRENGTGEALLERVTILASIRGVILYTNLLSYIKSSVTNTEVKVDLDADDPNFRKTSEQIMGWVMKNRQIDLPMGMLRAEDFVDWARKLGISFNFKHPGLPDVNIDIDEKSTEIKPIDSDLKETIDKYIVTALLLTPEMLDADFNPEFATSIIASNKLLAKRVKKLQRKYDALITEDIKRKFMLDGKIKNTLVDIVVNNKVKIKAALKNSDPNINKDALKKISDDVLAEYVINDIFKNLKVTLPKPEVTDDTNTKDLLDNFMDTLDKVLDSVLSTDLIPDDLLGDLGDKADNIKDAIKVVLIKRFIDENNVLPEVSKMLMLNEDGEPSDDLLSDFKTHIETISKIALPFLKANTKFITKTDDKLDKIENGEEEEEEPDDSGEDEKPNEESDNTSEEDNSDEEGSDEPKEEESEEEPKD